MSGRQLGLVQFCIVLVTACFAARPALAQQGTFSLADRVRVGLPREWTEARQAPLPPPSLLVASAPKWKFSDVMVLENAATESVLKLAISDNPLIGRDAAFLDGLMHKPDQGLVPHLFYLFFPPPRTCLAQAKAELEAARQAEIARHEEEEARAKEKGEHSSGRLRDVSVSRSCDFAPTLADFFASQVSPGISLNTTGESRGKLLQFYLPPTEQVEIAGNTFFIFEADGERFIDRRDLDFFSFPESFQGARAYFFWGLGAETPFPFVFDPLRKNVPLIHVVYATLNTTGNARDDFKSMLNAVRWD